MVHCGALEILGSIDENEMTWGMIQIDSAVGTDNPQPARL